MHLGRIPTQNTLQYGIMEYNPVIIHGQECWWFINGKWHELHIASYWMNGQDMTKEAFQKTFGHLPVLPAEAFQDKSAPG